MRILIGLLFVALHATAQLNCTGLNSVQFQHNINVESLQYHYAQRKERILTYTPLHKRIKITIKAGLSNSIISKVNMDDLKSGDLQDAFNDIEAVDVLSIVKYDFRTKFYLSKRWRILFRTQVLGVDKNVYTLGLFWKV